MKDKMETKMRTSRRFFPKRLSDKSSVLLFCVFAVAVLYFSGIMFFKIVPYMTFERALNFLGTKEDDVLDKTHFIWAFYIHITSSIIVMAGGVFQFFSIFLKEMPRFHRFLGKIYIGSILFFAAPSGLVLAFYANGGLPSRVGFSLQCVVWWVITALAWREILAKNYVRHTEMMLRSYAVTLAAMSLRFESYALYYFFGTKPIETYLTVTWLSWVGNLLLVELFIYSGMGKRLVRLSKT